MTDTCSTLQPLCSQALGLSPTLACLARRATYRLGCCLLKQNLTYEQSKSSKAKCSCKGGLMSEQEVRLATSSSSAAPPAAVTLDNS